MLRTLTPQVCFQEVPFEIALGFVCTGCQLGCKGCHSTHIWDADIGEPIDIDSFSHWLTRYEGLITCVVFFGGEWQTHTLLCLFEHALSKGLKTCLYTGLEHVSDVLLSKLTYLKTGPYIQALGGLEQPNTNQRFIDVASGQLLNSYFIKG